MQQKTAIKHKRLSNRSTTPQQDMVKELTSIDTWFDHSGEYHFTYKIKSTDTQNHYMVQTQHEKDQLLSLMMKVYGFLTEYEANIKQAWRDELMYDTPWFGEPQTRLRRDPMAGFGQRNQQSIYNVIGGQMIKLARVIQKNEDISREMITRFNQVVGMIVVEDYGYDAQGNVRYKPRCKIKAERQ